MGLNPINCFSACLNNSTLNSPVGDGQRVLNIGSYGRLYSYKELSVATQGFHSANKIGQGGFGPVFKGKLKDGTLVAVKVLALEAKQGEKEFLSEIAAISNIRHENLVELYGCCTDGNHTMLIYAYMENQSLFKTLFDGEDDHITFHWRVRRNICVGVASGLAFLHEHLEPYIVHRDIKASNILLDGNLNPKIADFGFAKLFPDNATHISTRVAGTLGYLAPEYALHGKLTRKADTYSFGVLMLEIVTGRCITNSSMLLEEENLLRMAWDLYKIDRLSELVDPKLDLDNDVEEAIWFLKVALLCVQQVPSLRPKMSAVLKMMNNTHSRYIEVSEPAFTINLECHQDCSQRIISKHQYGANILAFVGFLFLTVLHLEENS